MGEVATLSNEFHLAIPEALRTQQGWRAGQRFVFLPKGGGVLLVPVPERQALHGVASGADPRDYRDRADRTE